MSRDGVPIESGTGGLVSAIYLEVLGVPAAVDDDFFDLGGHSMLAVPAMSELSEAVGTDLPLSLIFDHPVVRELADAVDRHLTAEAGRSFTNRF